MNQAIESQKETPIKALNGAVKVKNAILMKIGKDKYVLQHYDTIILEVVAMEILIIAKISVSSTRAINQALQYLGFGLSAQEIVKQFKKEGRFVKTRRD